MTKDETYLNSCKKAIIWCENQIQSDGSIDLWFNSKYHSKSSYPIAQLIRLMILFDKATENTIFYTDVQKLFGFMKKLHVVNGPQKAIGGFYEEFYKSALGWKMRHNVNSWGTLFALQSIQFKENYDKISFDTSIEYLF